MRRSIEYRDPSPFHELAHDRRELELPGVQRDHDVHVSRKGQAGPGAKARPMIRVRCGIEEARPSGDQRQIDRLSAEVRALHHLLERRPEPERREWIVVVALIHGLDGLRAGVEPLADETVHHEIGEAVVEIRDEPIEMPGELRGFQAGAKSVQEGPGAAQQAPSARDDLPRKSGHLEASKGQRATHRRPQHRLAAEIERPWPASLRHNAACGAWPSRKIPWSSRDTATRNAASYARASRARPIPRSPAHCLTSRRVRSTPDAAMIRQTRRRLFRGPGS